MALVPEAEVARGGERRERAGRRERDRRERPSSGGGVRFVAEVIPGSVEGTTGGVGSAVVGSRGGGGVDGATGGRVGAGGASGVRGELIVAASGSGARSSATTAPVAIIASTPTRPRATTQRREVWAATPTGGTVANVAAERVRVPSSGAGSGGPEAQTRTPRSTAPG